MKKRSVVWTEIAATSLDKFCEYIAEDSPSAAKIVKDGIINTAGLLSANPEIYQMDEYLGGTGLNIRRFFKWSYKIVYEVLDDKIVILNVYHTKAER